MKANLLKIYYNTVESKFFYLFIFNYLIVYSDIPALYHRQLKHDLLLLYHNAKNELESELLLLFNNNNIKYSFTFDCWTSNNQQSYMGITIHYFNSEFQLKSYLIGMEDLKEKHSGQYLLQIFIQCLDEYNLSKKIFRYLLTIINNILLILL